jgi:hypothetical protein
MPPIPPLIPPQLPSAAPPVIPIQPRFLPLYRLWCALFVLMWLGMCLYGVLEVTGKVEPSLGLLTDLTTKNDPKARAQALAESREDAVGVVVIGAIAAVFYAFAAMVPRKPWGWGVGMGAIIASLFPFIITAAGMVPLLIAWTKPETRRCFNKRV